MDSNNKNKINKKKNKKLWLIMKMKNLKNLNNSVFSWTIIQSEMKNKLLNWHINLITKVQKITGLSNYQIIWLSFIEGLIIGLLIGYYI